MAKPEVMRIEVIGPVGIGKSAVLASIRDMLTNYGYAIAVLDPSERKNPSKPLDQAEHNERPNRGRAVIVLSETTELP